MVRHPALASAALLALAGATPGAAAPAAPPPFTLDSADFRDGAMLDRRHGGATPGNANCLGQNVSPALAWRNVPDGTQSIAIIMSDPEGRSGAGVVHWVAYGIRPALGGFATGATSVESKDYVGGKGTAGMTHYVGPCTPPNQSPHHYTFVALATDLAPDALAPGMTRDELLARLQGHVKGVSGLVGRFVHP
jgi:Raf kinase inhibitor-like YbhB/YbcL family protein